MSVKVVRKDDSVLIEGPVVFETVAYIQSTVLGFYKQEPVNTGLILNLSAVKEVNSAALGLFIELKKYVLKHHQRLTFVNPPEQLLSLAQLYAVSGLLGLSVAH